MSPADKKEYKRRTQIPNPRPWRVERWSDGKGGASGISILDAEGCAVANMIPQCGFDNEMANAKELVEAVNSKSEVAA